MIIMSDIQYAVRLLLKKPGFTLLTTFVMATGVGLSVFLFSMFNTMIFKDLPFEDSDLLVKFHSDMNGEAERKGIDLVDYHEIKTNLKGVQIFGGYQTLSVNASGRDGARRYAAAKSYSSIFELSRTKPLLGRGFTEAENQPNAEPVVVIGFDVWQSQFGGDQAALNQVLRINGESHRVIGVMPAGYFFPSNTELWLPLRQDPTRIARDKEYLEGVALLEPGYSRSEVNRQLGVIMQRIAERYPETNRGVSTSVNSFQRGVERDGIAVVYSMHIAAILILLLASINVGNLLYSRAIERGKETAIRVALGAPRSRLISQMLWESTIICSLGGLIGLLALAWGLEVTAATVTTFFVDKPSFWWVFGIDAYTLKIFAAFVIGTILATGLLPAWKNSGADFNAVLRDGTRGALGKKSGRLNRLLVISEIFLSMTVLIAAATMVVGAYKSTHADFGTKSDNILTARILLTDTHYHSHEQRSQFATTLVSHLETNSSISSVIMASALPADWAWTPEIAVEGKEYAEGINGGFPKAYYVTVTPGSLSKLGVELQQGRYFNSSDDGLDKATAIVTDSFVTQHFANESPLGKRVRILLPDNKVHVWLQIVGVVKHTIYGDANNSSGKTPSVFRPFSQAPGNSMTIALAMKADRDTVIRSLRETLASLDPELPVFQIEDYSDKIRRNAAPIRFISGIFLIFGVVAAALAATGIYGVMSNTINQRTQEIGVKRALGAQEERITREFLMTGIRQLLWGGIPGAIAGGAMAFAMANIIGIEATDLTFIVLLMMCLISGAVMLATYLPTKRALRLEPSDALRHE